MSTSTTILQVPALEPVLMTTAGEPEGSLPANASPYPLEAQQRIEELEAQVKILTLRATSAGKKPARRPHR